MENNSTKQSKGLEDGASRISRRKLLQVTAVGGLIAVTGLHLVLRKTNKNQFEFDICGPFENYGYFQPDDLDIKPQFTNGISLKTVLLDENKSYDSIFVIFSFAEKEDSKRKMNIEMSVIDNKGNVLSERQENFDDPRLLAKQKSEIIRGGRRLVRIPEVEIHVDLPRNTKITQISKIRVVVTPIFS